MTAGHCGQPRNVGDTQRRRRHVLPRRFGRCGSRLGHRLHGRDGRDDGGHGDARHGGDRGGREFKAPNWWMGMASRRAAGGNVTLTSLLEAELCGQLLLARLHPTPTGCWNGLCVNMPGT